MQKYDNLSKIGEGKGNFKIQFLIFKEHMERSIAPQTKKPIHM